MIARVEETNGRWTGQIIDDDGKVLYASGKVEPRPGCAMRTLLNGWQLRHGTTTMTFELDIDDW